MPGFIERAKAAVEAGFEGARVVAFGHLGDGNVHFNVQPPAAAEAEAWLAAKSEEVTRLVHDLVGESGGSISAEHGIGQSKIAELVRTADPARLAALRAIKNALDPAGIMNPGKLIASSPPAAAAEAGESGP
jgi:FAD/FMN-containing dehydrogenase